MHRKVSFIMCRRIPFSPAIASALYHTRRRQILKTCTVPDLQASGKDTVYAPGRFRDNTGQTGKLSPLPCNSVMVISLCAATSQNRRRERNDVSTPDS